MRLLLLLTPRQVQTLCILVAITSTVVGRAIIEPEAQATAETPGGNTDAGPQASTVVGLTVSAGHVVAHTPSAAAPSQLTPSQLTPSVTPAPPTHSSPIPRSSSQELGPSVSLDRAWARNYSIGQNFSLQCHVHGLRSNQHIFFLRLLGDSDYIISNGTKLRPETKRTGRYRVSISNRDASVVATLHITGLSHEDGGRLGCKIGPNGHGATFTDRELTLHVPVHDIRVSYLSLNGSYTTVPDGGTVTLLNTHHRVKSGLMCKVVVKSGSIIPQVGMWLNNHEITDRFKKTSKTFSTQKGGLVEKGHVVTLMYETYNPRSSENNKRLECRAKVPIYDEKKRVVNVNVTFPPVFHGPAKFYGWMGDFAKVITCNVSMNPRPRHATWWWRETGRDVFLPTEGATPHYTTSEKLISNDFSQFSLRMNRIRHEDFRNYYLEIDNGMGLTRVEIVLQEGDDPGGCTSLHTSRNIVMVVMAVTSVYSLHGYGCVT